MWARRLRFRLLPAAKPTRLAVAAILVAAGVLALLSLQFAGGQGAYALGTINFDIDPNPSENTPSTLGTVEDCVRIDGSGGFDGVADVTIDVVV